MGARGLETSGASFMPRRSLQALPVMFLPQLISPLPVSALVIQAVTDPVDKMDRKTNSKSSTRMMIADLLASVALAVGIGVGASLALGAAVLVLAQPSGR